MEILKERYKSLVDENLRKYVESDVLPLYDSKNVDDGHKRPHIEYVVNRSMNFAQQYNKTHDDKIDYNMVYVVGAYHDIGLSFAPRQIHEQASASFLSADKKLPEFFTDEQINIMSKAAGQHRASLKGEPDTVYGKIVSQADRDTNVDTILKRTFAFRCNKEPYSHDYTALKKDIVTHLSDKYTKNGYGAKKFYFKDEDYENFIREIDSLVKYPNSFDKKLKETIKKVSPSKYEEYMQDLNRSHIASVLNAAERLNQHIMEYQQEIG